MEQLAIWEKSEFDRLESVIESGLKTFVDVGMSLRDIRDKKLYRQDFDTFENYCNTKWNLSKMRVYQIMDSATVMENLKGKEFFTFPKNAGQATELAGLDPEEQIRVWEQVIDTAPEGKITAAIIKTVREMNKPHVSFNSGENEWYTPPNILEAARNTMGGIDTDPASSEKANTIVKSGLFYTVETNGLNNIWRGNVWMNPPYSQPQIYQFCNALVDKYLSSEFNQACVLVNNATETQWYQTLMRDCTCVCFLSGRVKFIDINGEASGAPLQGQTVLYFGKNADKFSENFSGFGVILYAG